MTENLVPEPAPAEHAFQVTQFKRPAGQFGSWSQETSGEMNADDAHSWIDERNQQAVDQGLTPAQAVAGAPEPTDAGDPQLADDQAASVDPGAVQDQEPEQLA